MAGKKPVSQGIFPVFLAMQFFSVYITFRGHGIRAHIHQHDSFYLVGFTDDDLLQDFGGQLEFDKVGNYTAGAKTLPRDAVDLFRAIKAALANI